MAAVRWREAERTKSPVLRKSSPLGDRQDLMDQLRGRDKVLLIHNSSSMERYRSEIASIMGLFAWILKNSDEDGIDVYFTGSSDALQNKSYDKIIEHIAAISYSGDPDLAQPMKMILARYIQSQHANDLGPSQNAVEGVLHDFVRGLKDTSIEKNGGFGIQFITFGDDSAASARLNYLKPGPGHYSDIVDVEPCDGNVWKMLLGSIPDYLDDDPVYHGTTSSPRYHIRNSQTLQVSSNGSKAPTLPVQQENVSTEMKSTLQPSIFSHSLALSSSEFSAMKQPSKADDTNRNPSSHKLTKGVAEDTVISSMRSPLTSTQEADSFQCSEKGSMDGQYGTTDQTETESKEDLKDLLALHRPIWTKSMLGKITMTALRLQKLLI
ncbi:hypothetical protein SLS55_003174 [Diplodia seriata]|uniref:Uncharacterized protein n=1 Tax=Diplodia seriata TaxID=420778 RepID=A0ABR3CQJ2_9PEZI